MEMHDLNKTAFANGSGFERMVLDAADVHTSKSSAVRALAKNIPEMDVEALQETYVLLSDVSATVLSACTPLNSYVSVTQNLSPEETAEAAREAENAAARFNALDEQVETLMADVVARIDHHRPLLHDAAYKPYGERIELAYKHASSYHKSLTEAIEDDRLSAARLGQEIGKIEHATDEIEAAIGDFEAAIRNGAFKTWQMPVAKERLAATKKVLKKAQAQIPGYKADLEAARSERLESEFNEASMALDLVVKGEHQFLFEADMSGRDQAAEMIRVAGQIENDCAAATHHLDSMAAILADDLCPQDDYMQTAFAEAQAALSKNQAQAVAIRENARGLIRQEQGKTWRGAIGQTLRLI